jgi:hypothetical protein
MNPRLSPHGRQLLDRRDFLTNSATALSAIALTHLLSRDRLLADAPRRPAIDAARPYAPRPPHFAAKASKVIVIFCAGAVSQLETWDYKPELIRWDDRPLPGGPAVTFQGPAGNLARPQYTFRRRGQTGKWVSDLIPHLAELTDDLAFVHSLTSRTNTHGPAENFLSTGFALDGFPSLGSWVTYALGSANQNLPAFVAIPDPRGVPQSGSNNWGPGFLPAAFQGTPLSSSVPVRHLTSTRSAPEDRATRALLERMNARHLAQHADDGRLAARIASYELAARMQLSVPDINDLASEPAHILRLYGADDVQNPVKAAFARNCILARRLLERGVRFVQLFSGGSFGNPRINWDGHENVRLNHGQEALRIDQPVAALLVDLRRRGMLVGTGRDHNQYGFTVWLAGAGLKGGVAYGATDDIGWKSVENIVHWHDFHATVLHLFGIDHQRLTFYHNGIQRRLTNVHGELIAGIL